MHVSINIGHTPNYATVYVGPVRLEFSYSTIVGFFGPTDSAASENLWGPTTGKHLNRFSDKADRIPREEFQRRLDAQLALIGTGVAA